MGVVAVVEHAVEQPPSPRNEPWGGGAEHGRRNAHLQEVRPRADGVRALHVTDLRREEVSPASPPTS